MLKGGYQIIDLKNRDLHYGGVVIDGIYDKINGTRKAILLSGLVYGGVEYHDMFVFPVVDGNNYKMWVGIDNSDPTAGMFVVVSDNDVVTAMLI